jgi:hypothetical protein
MKPQYKMQVSAKVSQNKLNITAGKVVRAFLMIFGAVAIAQMVLRAALSYYMIPISAEVATSTPTAVDQGVEEQREENGLKAELQMIVDRQDDDIARIEREGDQQRIAIAQAELDGASIGSSNRSTELLIQDQLTKKIAVRCQALTEMKSLLKARKLTEEVKLKYGITELESSILESCKNSSQTPPAESQN